LQMTRNKLPRWLSEGISVFEERQANPAWGQSMNARYREMILGDEFLPIGKLSAAFLTPKDMTHLEFAYFQSSLAVEFLVEQFGLNTLKSLLRELREGADWERAMEKCYRPFPRIERDFALFARQRARTLAPTLDWEKPSSSAFAGKASVESDVWFRAHPNNYWGLTEQAKQLIAAKQFEAAKAPLNRLIQAWPDNAGPDNAYALLAQVHRALNEPALERAALSKLALLDSDAVEAYQRLMELGEAARDWPMVLANAERYLAVNPLVAPPHRFLALAAEATNQRQTAIQAYQVVLALYPHDPADVHYRIARLMRQAGQPQAKRHVLQALEEAPRFRAAYELLSEINSQPPD